MNDRISRKTNNPQQLSGPVRIIDRRNRLKQVEREPRSSSVPICKERASPSRRNRVKVSIDDSRRTNRTNVVSWNVAEEDSVSSGKNSFAHARRNIQTIRDRFFPPSSQNALNGKPPPYNSTNHIDFSQDRWQVASLDSPNFEGEPTRQAGSVLAQWGTVCSHENGDSESVLFTMGEIIRLPKLCP
ncbi:unnamed protein product [Rodentolepis nana]|uniref:Uncharacterized protein n=1 Tax=Rodentolepis nana TaxID=102285 RepID=A0A0R3TX65_RODNA|nr:unnamed protein product [Rodentolepis nana]